MELLQQSLPDVNFEIVGLLISALFVVGWLLQHYAAYASVVVCLAFLGFFYWSSRNTEYDKTIAVEAPSPITIKNDVDVYKTRPQMKRINYYKGVKEALKTFEPFKQTEIGSFETIVTMLDRFFYIYELIMLDRMPCSDIQRLNDLKNEILNMEKISKTTSELHTILFSYIKIARRKCRDSLEQVEEGLLYGHDPTKSPHDLF
jgi:hypothetical protein